MKEKLEERLAQLKEEYVNGQRILADLKQREMNLRETLLRISGAVQVLEEELEGFTESTKAGENENAS